ncbi:MAG: arginine repressor [Oscillospiraceae bacterium]|jgi:transcriptional regulator of arginine metabolism|nr:arginine repressor [Oscillospiraceae bacterium]MCI9587763.1 arginine repressor [Oscillospiraceae bacterium]
MKNERQGKILSIIAREDIDTQELLMERLQREGISCTQATISRDIKQLHLIKEPVGRGRYRYAVSVRQSGLNVADKLRTIFRESVLSIDCAQNIVVVKTLLGLANGAAAALDSMELPYLVGTLAGEDTVLLVMRDSRSADGFCAEIGEMLPLSGGDQKKE